MVDFTENFSQYAVSKLPTFRDNFTFHGTQAEADLAWVPEDVARSRVNTATDVLDLDIFRDNTNDAIVHDLGDTVSDSNWVLRFKLIIDTLSLTALQTQGFFGLFDGNGAEGEETQQNSIGVALTALTGTLTYRLFTSENDFISQGVSNTFTHALAVETVYVEIKRNSKTSFEVNLYSDAKFTDLIESRQGISTVGTIDLRYIGMKNNMSMTNGSRILGSMDNVEFWDSEKQIIFSDDFATATNWVQTGTGVSITGGVISGWGADAVDRRLTHDLGAPLSDSEWKTEFEYMFTASNVPAHAPLIISDINQDIDAGTNDNDFIGVIHGTSVDELKIIAGDSDDLGGAGFGSTGIPISTSTTYFVRLERVSPVLTRLSVFSDASFTTHIASSPVILAIPITIDALQFVHSQNLSGGGIGRTLTGTLDNLEISEQRKGDTEGAVTFEEKFKLRTGDFEDDFSGTDDWLDAHASSGVNTTTDVIDYTFSTSNQNEAMVFDLENILGVGNVADPDKWTLRFKFNITSTTPSSSNLFYVGLNNTAETTDSSIAQHGVNIAILDATGGIQGYRTYDWDNQIPNVTGHDAQEISNPFLISTDYFAELKRTSSTTYECQVFTDAGFSIPFGARITGTLTTTAGLRYIKILNIDTATAINLVGTIDDVKFYNGESVLTNWIDQGTGFSVNTLTQFIDWDAQIDGAVNGTWIDLGSTISDTDWTLRWRHIIKNLTVGAVATVNEVHFAITDLDGTNGTNTAQDAIGFRHIIGDSGGGGEHNWNIYDEDGATLPQGVSGDEATFTTVPTAGTFYMELKRTSATTYEMNIYSDSDYSELIEQQTGICLATTQSLRYLKVMCRENASAGDSTLNGTIDCIELYDCSSVANTPVKSTVPDFEDSFWEDNWTDVGAQHGVNVSTRVIDWDSARLAEAINQTTFDLETLFPEGINPVKWGLRFKYRIDALTAGGASSQFAVFLTNLASNNSSEVAQDHATWKIQGNVPPLLAGMIDDGTQIYTGASSSFGNGAPVGEFGYAEMTRNGTLFSWAVYSDPDFTQLLGSGSRNDNSVLSGLRYLKVGRRDGTATAFTFNGIVDNIQFWNGNEPTEHKSKWVEVNVP